MDLAPFAVYGEWSKEAVAGMAWGCPTTHGAIARLAPVLCPQQVLLVQEGTGEVSWFLCSLLHKAAGLYGDNLFQGSTDAWGNSPLCTSQISPF